MQYLMLEHHFLKENIMPICFKILSCGNQNNKPDKHDKHVFTCSISHPYEFGLREDKRLEYNFNVHNLIAKLHKLLVSNDYDNKKQMLNIFAHICFRVIDHVIIHAYVEFYI